MIAGAFFYPWYGNPNGPSGGWHTWEAGGYSPPNTWYSNLLPDAMPTLGFDPSLDLYDSKDIGVLDWQLSNMGRAGLQFACSAWYDSNDNNDKTLQVIMRHMLQPNPYPTFKWAAFYSNGTKDQAGMTDSLHYILQTYGNNPAYFRQSGKPVFMFWHQWGENPYAASLDWNALKSAVDGFFFIHVNDIMNNPTAKQAADVGYGLSTSTYYSLANASLGSVNVSAGYWENPVVATQRGHPVYACTPPNTAAPWYLPRNPVAFQAGVQQAVAANSRYLLCSWNEYLEGTALEPAMPVQNYWPSQSTPFTQCGPSWGMSYVDILGSFLGVRP